MKVTYKGLQKELPPKLQEKLDGRFLKLSKILEHRGEKEAHVVLTMERHLHTAEVTVQYYDHQLLGIGSDADEFTALTVALEKLEKQAVKQTAKWRDKGRRAEISTPEENAEPLDLNGQTKSQAQSRVFRVEHLNGHKPMTLEEALLEIDNDQDYLVYRDAEKQGISVLVRRRDGNFDLIES